MTPRRSICMHATSGPRRSQTVSSMTSDLTPGRTVHWVTATAAPCLSLFKPVVMGLPLPDVGPPPSDRFDDESLWWRHERLHRVALDDFPAAMALIAEVRDAMETTFRERMDDAWGHGETALAAAVTRCWRDAETAEARWSAALSAARRAGPSAIGRSAAAAWGRLNHVAGFSKA
jgi:hypothetical protein